MQSRQNVEFGGGIHVRDPLHIPGEQLLHRPQPQTLNLRSLSPNPYPQRFSYFKAFGPTDPII